MQEKHLSPVFTREGIVTASLCDASGRLGLAQQFSILQDLASEHAALLGVGADDMLARGQYWVVTHTRLNVFARAGMNAPLTMTTWPNRCAPEDVRSFRSYRIESGGTLLAEGRSEWIVLNAGTNRPVRLRETCFPFDLDFCEAVAAPEPFLREREEFCERDACFTRPVAASDVDSAQHMNNVAYVRAMLDAFSVRELAELPASSITVRYGDPCHEGDAITVAKQPFEGGFRLAVLKADGRVSASMRLNL
jgi:acyl-ACP thioesterase